MRISNLENEGRKVTARAGMFSVLEYERDRSVSGFNATTEFFMSKMGVRRRQVICSLDGSQTVTVQAGAMQWMAGSVQMTSGVKGVGDLFKKSIKGAVTKEAAAKPEYTGRGLLVLEPTYKYMLLMDVSKWGPAGMVVEDGMFYACDGGVTSRVVMRKSASSAILGGEGLFNLALSGNGVAVLESNVPFDELVTVELNNEELKIDGNLAVCWSGSLDFTVERSAKTLVGSAISGEGLVNVYRGTGLVMMAPVTESGSLFEAQNDSSAKPSGKGSNTMFSK